MTRRLLIATQLVCLALFLLVSFAWIDSRVNDQPYERRWADNHHAWVSHDGRLAYLRWGHGDLPWLSSDTRLVTDCSSLPATAGGLGFHYFKGLRNNDCRYAHATVIAVPYWFLASLTLLPIARCACALGHCPKCPATGRNWRTWFHRPRLSA